MPFRVTQATLDVLEVLMGPDGELYGLKIARNAGRKVGSVYPILARLEQAGWVESRWEGGDRGDRGPRRRFYRFSPEGREAARALLIERRGAVRRRIGVSGPIRRPRPVTGSASVRRPAR